MELITAIKISGTVIGFIKSGYLAQAMYEIGDNELNIAIEVLKDIKYEKNPNLAITRVLTHLESAYQHTYEYNYSWKHVFSTIDCISKIRKLCDLIAICHYALGNDKSVIEKWLIDKHFISEESDMNKPLIEYMLGDSGVKRAQKLVDDHTAWVQYVEEHKYDDYESPSGRCQDIIGLEEELAEIKEEQEAKNNNMVSPNAKE